METMKIAICEDLESERQDLVDIINKSQYSSSLDIFTSAEDFLAQFKAFKYDLILMDIYMTGITGIEAISKIREVDKEVSVAFVTSSKDFGLESYRLDALKYIEKPVSKSEVEKTLKIAYSRKSEEESLVVRTGSKSNSYQFRRIVCLEQNGRNAIIHLTGGESVSVAKKITELEDQFEDKQFLRCHKSYIVNLNFVKSIDKELMIFKMTEGENVHISRKLFWSLKKDFENFIFGKLEEI